MSPKRDHSGRKSTPVASLFTEIFTTAKIPRVRCTFCSFELSKSGSRMETHIKKCSKVPEMIKEKYVKSNIPAKKIKLAQESLAIGVPTLQSEIELEPGSSLVSPSSSIKNLPGILVQKPTGKNKNQTMLSFMDKINKTDQEKGNELIARAIYASGTPLSIVENPFWLEFFHFLRPVWKIPTRYEVSTPLLQTEYERVYSKVNTTIASAESVAMMSDGWSNLKNEPIINIVLTTPTPVLYKIIETGKESHTGEYMASEMDSVIKEVGPQKVFGVVTDNAANMKAAWEIIRNKNENTNLFTYGCIAHTLNLIFSDMKKLTSLKSFLVEAVAVVKAIKNSHKLAAIFKEKQTLNSPSLKLPVATRWGSIVHCFESIFLNKQAIQSIAIEESLKIVLKNYPVLDRNALNEDFWDLVKGFYHLLKPIADAITSIESDKPRISSVVRVFKKLEIHFEETLSKSLLSDEEKGKVKEIIAKRKSFGVCDVHKAAALLDPFLKGVDLTPEEQVF